MKPIEALNNVWLVLFMELLIERKNVHYLQKSIYHKAEVIQQDYEIRILLYSDEQQPTVFVLIEPAKEGEMRQIEQLLAR